MSVPSYLPINTAPLQPFPNTYIAGMKLTLDCGRGIALDPMPVLALAPPPMLVRPLAPILPLPLAPKLARPALLELMDCLLSPSEEPGREGIIALMLNGDASWNSKLWIVLGATPV
jgi:hypothetical protein